MMSHQNISENHTRSFFQKISDYPAFLRDYSRWKLGFCRRLRINDPIFVYQMGKVASRSLAESLSSYYNGEVIHSHWFSPDIGPGEAQELYHYWHSKHPPKCVHIITLVRNPIDRNVSAFFQNFNKFTGCTPDEFTTSINDLKSVFLKEYEHDTPLVWFDNKINANFSIDVYSRPFSSKGYDIFTNERTRLLLMRVEDNDDIKTRAVQVFLDIPDFVLERKNVASNKDYGILYKRFKKEVRFPKTYVDKFCNSKVFKHFYSTKDEINTRRRWQQDYQE